MSEYNAQDVSVMNIEDNTNNELPEENTHNSMLLNGAIYKKTKFGKTMCERMKNNFIDAIEDKLTARNVKNQNANVDERSFGGRMGEAASYMTKDYALKYLVSDMARKNHLENRIYIHDLDHYAVGSHNCLSIPFDDLLANGFNTRQADIRPANSINTAFQLVAVIF